MKKNILSVAVMALGSTLLTGCLGDDNNNNEKQEYIVTDGVLIVNNGNTRSGIDGCMWRAATKMPSSSSTRKHSV